MMKKLLIMSAIVSSYFVGLGQNVDYNKIIVPGSPSSLSDEERLVQLAWKNYPGNEILYHELTSAKANVNIQKWAWLNQFYAQGNLNEFTINPDETQTGGNFWPRYNFGVNMPLGIFVKVPNETKRAKAQREMAEASIDRQKLFIRSTVIGFYREYLSLVEIYKIEKQASDDADDIFKLEEQKFKNGEITLDKYSISVDYKNIKRIRTISAENDYVQIKIKLEEFIGMRLEDALGK